MEPSSHQKVINVVRQVPSILFLFLLCSLPASAQLSGFHAESLTLQDGRTLSNITFQDITPNSVILLQDQTLFTIPLARLPDPLKSRAREELDNRPLPNPETRARPDSAWMERRRAEIEANRQAQREIAIAKAQNNPSSSEEDSSPNVQPPQWNDLELLNAEFGCHFGIITLHNTGGTSRDIQNWDFEIIYSDGSTLSPRFFRPNRIDRDSLVEFSFQVPDRGFRTPTHIRFTYGDDHLLPINRDCLEIDQPRYRSRPGSFHRR